MKVSAQFAVLGDLSAIRNVKFTGPMVMSLNPVNLLNDNWFAPIAGMHGQFESYALRVEKMYDELIKLGGSDLVVYMLNLGQELSGDLGWANGRYAFGLRHPFAIDDLGTSRSMVAVHFTDWAFRMAMDKGEDGMLDFEHEEFDEFIQSLRDNLANLK